MRKVLVTFEAEVSDSTATGEHTEDLISIYDEVVDKLSKGGFENIDIEVLEEVR